MPHSFDYAVIRVVPRVERAEFLNVGVILFCRTLRFLKARVEIDERRLLVFAPGMNPQDCRRHLAALPLICEGGEAAGPIGALTQAERFHWLVSPRSTLIQTSPVHCGLCTEPDSALSALVQRMVTLPASPAESPQERSVRRS